ncbi:hypothetical protein ACFWH1_30805 [Streptomyces sp. NPDC127037]|uniref:hypothetical protein n=1 Tax=Streptomyces sp. NPDC127037 TaxID=3347113 RepID=UPI0036520768
MEEVSSSPQMAWAMATLFVTRARPRTAWMPPTTIISTRRLLTGAGIRLSAGDGGLVHPPPPGG